MFAGLLPHDGSAGGGGAAGHGCCRDKDGREDEKEMTDESIKWVVEIKDRDESGSNRYTIFLSKHLTGTSGTDRALL